MYTAASTNPTTPEQIKATRAPLKAHAKGIKKTGHNGKGLLGLRNFSRSFVGSGGRRRRTVRDKRDVVKNAIEQMKNRPPNRIRFQ